MSRRLERDRSTTASVPADAIITTKGKGCHPSHAPRLAAEGRTASQQRFHRVRNAEAAPGARSLLREETVRKLPLEINGLC